MPSVSIENGRASVTFDRFDLDAYEVFLRAKKLPERELVYDWRTDSYTLSTAARYAGMLDEGLAATSAPVEPLAEHLFDYQAFIVGQALAARRYAIWADTGLGKTLMFLEWARQVQARTGGRVLVFAPTHELIGQHCDEWRHFYPAEDPLELLKTRAALTGWCSVDGRPAIGIATYALMVPGELPELRKLAGLVLDESSLLKSGGGTIKWNVIHSAKGIDYKLSCTATPAPNDTMEYASQAAFLEKLRSEGEILWTYFTRDNKTNAWSVKPHAREAFFRFMSSWSSYLRNPARYGFADILASLPEPVMHEHRIQITEEQRGLMQELLARNGRGLFDERLGLRERSKLSQLAKGFLYEASGTGRAVRRVESAKPLTVAEIVRSEVAAGRPTLVWTVFDEESEILVDLLRDGSDFRRVAALHGSMSDEQRADALAAFRDGRAEVLVSKASLIGYGLNLQHAKAMVFSGFDDSFERLYQAIRRAYRFGQTDTVHVHVPVVPELEGLMLDNLRRKQEMFDGDVAVQEVNYRAALAGAIPTTTKEAVTA
jgi:superfamily II DNA or RNA helicase